MKFFDRFFGRNPSDDQEPEETGAEMTNHSESQDIPQQPEERNFKEQEHVAKALSVLLSLHKEKKTDETLMSVLRCLMENPPLWVPMQGNTPDMTESDAGEHLLPLFTSMDQVADSYREGRRWEQMLFLELKPYVTKKSGLSGILINGFSHEFVLHRMTFPMFFDTARAQSADGNAGVVPHTLQENKTFQLSPVGREADLLKEAAIKFLATHNCQKAYFGKLNNNGEESYLFAIEQSDCPDSEYFKLMHKELSAIPTNLPIDYTSYAGFRKHITPDNCQMIFHQGMEQ